MNKENLNNSLNTADLISGYLSSTLNESELARLSAWLEEEPENYSLFERICNEQNLNTAYHTFKKYDTNKALAQVKGLLEEKESKQVKPGIFWKRIAVAASVVFIFSLGFWLYTRTAADSGNTEKLIAGNIAPGKNKATLTLANGKKIALSDAKTGVVINAATLSYNDGSVVSGPASIPALNPNEYMVAETPRGGTYQVTLPDGSKVWLNAASTLKFPSQFSGLVNRKIELSGEAYFEIFKDAKHPFIVKTAKQEVTVLGTHFNISSYADEPLTKTTLLEGSVKINNSTILKPGEQASLNKAGLITIAQVETEGVIAWKNGFFLFDNETLESLLKKVSRWYNVAIEYEDPTLRNEHVYGLVSRSENVSVLLEKLELTGEVKFKFINNRIIVSATK